MLNLTVNRINTFRSIILGILFGVTFFKFLPLATTNIFFLFAVPLICIFFLLMLINLKFMLIALLFLRVLLDPLLSFTKLNMYGENIGAGGAINLFIIILAVSLIMRYPKRLAQNNFYKSWLLFLFICGIAIFYSPVFGRAIRLFLNLVSYMSMAIVPFFIINNINDKKFWIKILLFSSLLPVAFANIDLLSGGIFYRGYLMRIQGTFTHPNILAFYLVLIMALAFYILKSGLFLLTMAKRNMLWIYIGNLLVLLLATKTRSAWVACWGLFFIYGLLKEKKYILFCVILPLLLLLRPAIIDRIRDLFIDTSFGMDKRLNSFAWRKELWKNSLPLIKSKFIFGHGLRSFENLSPAFFALEKEGVASHNTYIELLFETGIVGLVSYITIYFTSLKTFLSKIRTTNTNLSKGYALIFSYIVSYMIVCFSDNMLYYLACNWYFWFFIGIMLRGIQLDNEKKDICSNTVI